MARIKIDVWGRTSTEPNFNTQPLQEYETDAIDGSGDGVIYTRFFNRTITGVHRTTITTENGRKSIKNEVAFGAWADRATLEYDEPANYPKYINVED